MKSLLIIGANGFGRDIYNLATVCKGYLKEYQVKGFLDDNKNALKGYESIYPPIIDSLNNYQIQTDDVFVCALGNVQSKKKCIQLILENDGQFITLIHPSAHIDSNAKIGEGCIILQNAVLGSGSKIGNYVLIQISTIIGHDSLIGSYSRIDCHAVCVGGVIIEDEVTIHTSAVINHKVTVGKGAIVGANSFVIRKVEENSTMYGNPAVKLK